MSEEDKLKTNNEKVTINDYYYYYLLKCENTLNELEKYIHNELVLDFYNDDMPCELIINKMEKMIKELKENNK